VNSLIAPFNRWSFPFFESFPANSFT
jgi:hypothetical protein